MNTRRRTLGAFVLGVALLTCAAQAEETPNPCLLSETIATIVIDEATIQSGLRVLIEKKDLDNLPRDVRSALEERLKRVKGGWEVLSEPLERIEDLPGKWKKVAGHRMNRTHVLIYIELSGSGDERRLKYGQIRGNHHGDGEEIIFRWKEGEWHAKIVVTTVS